MERRTVFLLPSDELGWTNVRQSLRSIPAVKLVGETTSLAEAIRQIELHHPNVVMTAWAVGEQPVALPLVRDLHSRGISPRVVVVASWFDPKVVSLLADLGVFGYLLWRDIPHWALRTCLEIAILTDVQVASRYVVDAYIRSCHGQGNQTTSINLTARQRRILNDLVRGMPQQAIALAEDLSAQTVQREISQLKEQLTAPSIFALGARAKQLGLVS